MDTNEIIALLAGVFTALFIGTLVILKNCYFTVVEGNSAILLRFGKVLRTGGSRGERGLRIFSSGLHFKFPWDQVLSFSTMEKVMDLSGSEGGQYALTSDGTLLRLDSKIRFSPIRTELYSYLFNLHSPIDHIRELFICVLRNEIANFKAIDNASSIGPIGSYDLIRRHRVDLNQKMAQFCSKIGPKYGVQFHSVDLIDILPPPELELALNSVLHAQTQAETQLMRAEAEANQKKEAARRGVEIAKLNANAQIAQALIIAETLEGLILDGSLNFYFQTKRDEVVSAAKMRILQSQRGV